MPRTSSLDPKASLAKYWFRAQLLHELLHTLRDLYDGDLDAMVKDGHWWEFETYLAYWLSALFVVVEGVNNSKIQDRNVTRLFNAHIGHLKDLRHETYHFVPVPGAASVPSMTPVIGALNWAEELHEAIGEHLRKHLERKAMVERFMEFRKTKKSPARKRK
jgi:hypothetical protein